MSGQQMASKASWRIRHFFGESPSLDSPYRVPDAFKSHQKASDFESSFRVRSQQIELILGRPRTQTPLRPTDGATRSTYENLDCRNDLDLVDLDDHGFCRRRQHFRADENHERVYRLL